MDKKADDLLINPAAGPWRTDEPPPEGKIMKRINQVRGQVGHPARTRLISNQYTGEYRSHWVQRAWWEIKNGRATFFIHRNLLFWGGIPERMIRNLDQTVNPAILGLE